MLKFTVKGDLHKTKKFLNKKHKLNISELKRFGEKGVNILRDNTPKHTGLTADSWYYTIEQDENVIKIVWKNSNVVEHNNVAILLQYGHGTRNGGWVDGIDYINPSLKPIFNELADKAWLEVTKDE